MTDMLTSENVEATIVRCLFTDAEMVDGQPPPEHIRVEGIVNPWAFHPGRVEENREKIAAMLSELPRAFMVGEGGGWSFLNACERADGVQWTAFHQRMDQLFSLGQACGYVTCQMPREMWSVLPGGMPYYAVDLPVPA